MLGNSDCVGSMKLQGMFSWLLLLQILEYCYQHRQTPSIGDSYLLDGRTLRLTSRSMGHIIRNFTAKTMASGLGSSVVGIGGLLLPLAVLVGQKPLVGNHRSSTGLVLG